MENHIFGALDRLKSLFNEMLPGLDQHLDGHVIGNMAPLNELPADFVLRLAGGGEADLDLLHPDVHQGVEVLQLLGQVHRVHQGLVAVPQVHGTPDGGLGNDLIGPGPAPDGLGLEGNVLFKFGFHSGVLLNKMGVGCVRGQQKAPDFFKSGACHRTRYHPGSADGRPTALTASNKALVNNETNRPPLLAVQADCSGASHPQPLLTPARTARRLSEWERLSFSPSSHLLVGYFNGFPPPCQEGFCPERKRENFLKKQLLSA